MSRIATVQADAPPGIRRHGAKVASRCPPLVSLSVERVKHGRVPWRARERAHVSPVRLRDSREEGNVKRLLRHAVGSQAVRLLGLSLFATLLTCGGGDNAVVVTVQGWPAGASSLYVVDSINGQF